MLCQNVTVFLRKTVPSFFQMQEKLKTCRNQIWHILEDHFFEII